MARTVRLHGGPWHGRQVAIEEGRSCIHISAPLVQPAEFKDPVKHPNAEPIARREGMYTQVSDSRYADDFEWDGWRTHD